MLDLLSSETFLWGGSTGNSRYALGNFTSFYPGKHENIISLEKFYPLLKSTQCSPHSLTMNFEDDKAYRYGAKAWKWVNDEDDRTFVLVAGQGHCEWNEDRLPFVITNVEFDDTANTIKAIGHASDWKKVSHSYELFVGGRPASNKRDYDDTYSFDVNHDLPLSHIQVGEFEFGFHISTWLGIPKDVELVLSPHGVEAVFEPRVGIVAKLPGKVSKTYPLGTIPIDGISIAGGILDLGPELEFGWGYSIGPLKGSAGITTGGTLSLSDSASMTIDLLNPDVSQSGWEPHFTPKEFTVDAALSGSVELDLFAKIQLALEALDHGFDVGVKLQPFGGATVSLAANSADACPDQKGKHEAVKLLPSVGAALIGEAAIKDNTESPFLSATLACSFVLGAQLLQVFSSLLDLCAPVIIPITTTDYSSSLILGSPSFKFFNPSLIIYSSPFVVNSYGPIFLDLCLSFINSSFFVIYPFYPIINPHAATIICHGSSPSPLPLRLRQLLSLCQAAAPAPARLSQLCVDDTL
ncbi:hypothetical protein N7509_000600 [Penicillium cosmopolitanum]|uniref:Uncharacterized protein n=1 Tax=Penicillium cosmopolitanum TaxID=1131564 RepID=A0A9X0BED6_9EURO|nr:uncharacterized protein N7509_000600 [Penicillium cosmopolitanum]KAJ5413973.1 hypothetical protein N7509_000600 [Penicillium cosmopolitanum]